MCLRSFLAELATINLLPQHGSALQRGHYLRKWIRSRYRIYPEDKAGRDENDCGVIAPSSVHKCAPEPNVLTDVKWKLPISFSTLGFLLRYPEWVFDNLVLIPFCYYVDSSDNLAFYWGMRRARVGQSTSTRISCSSNSDTIGVSGGWNVILTNVRSAVIK